MDEANASPTINTRAWLASLAGQAKLRSSVTSVALRSLYGTYRVKFNMQQVGKVIGRLKLCCEVFSDTF